MKNILILNFKRYGDIFSTAHLINSIKANDPNTNIHMLVFQEFQKAAVEISGIHQVHTLNRAKVLTLSQNDLFSDGIAINAFVEELSQLKKISWDNVVNYSNDKIGSYITSYLTDGESTFSGIRYDKHHNVDYSNDWALLFNEVITEFKHTPVNFIDCHHKTFQTNHKTVGRKLKVSEVHNQTAFDNINKIRKSANAEKSDVSIIGIQLKTSSDEKDIPFNAMIELIELVLDNPNFFPVLLIAPFESERAYVNELNKQFDNKLVTVEADFTAISSVLMNIDLLVTPDTVIKHMADLLDTPVLEVSLGNAPFFKQGTCNPNNLILTPKIDTRSFKIGIKGDDCPITGEDIYHSLECMFDYKKIKRLSLSEGISLYRSKRDSLGINYTHIAGDISTAHEISRHISRLYVGILLNGQSDDDLFKEVFKHDSKDIYKWAEIEKLQITNITKLLLGTLRSLLRTKDNNTCASEFVSSLDRLLLHCKGDSISSIPALLFRARVENLTSTNFASGMKNIEGQLYKLKKDIQEGIDLIKTIEELDLIKRKNFRKSKGRSSAQI